MPKPYKRNAATRPAIQKPGLCSLIVHIITGAFRGGMQIPALACIALAATAYYLQAPYHEITTATLIGGLTFVSLVSGCTNWSKSLARYRREIAIQHRSKQPDNGSQNQAIPGFIPYSHR